MNRRSTRPDGVKNRLTQAARDGQRRAASAVVALLLGAATLVLNEGNALAASAAEVTPGYQKVVERQGASVAVAYLDPSSEIDFPNGLRDVLTTIPYKRNGKWILQFFFRGTILAKSVDKKNSIFTLPSGAQITMELEPSDGSWKFDDVNDIYTRGDGSRFVHEHFQLPDGVEEVGMRCGDVRGGYVRLDASGHVLWRKTYVKLIRNLSDDDWGYCEHYPHQKQVEDQSILVGFGDDTIGVLVDDTLVRVSADTGMPVGPVSDVKVFDSAKVAAARAERYSKMSIPGGISEEEYYRLETEYFFPNTK